MIYGSAYEMKKVAPDIHGHRGTIPQNGHFFKAKLSTGSLWLINVHQNQKQIEYRGFIINIYG